jgi:hypothetical protein
MTTTPLDLRALKVLPLAARHSLTRCDDLLIPPDRAPPPLDERGAAFVAAAAAAIRAARARNASVMLIYGAHLLRNGAALLLERLMAGGWLTHLATNGAGTIHDWEYAWFGASTESVEMNVADGTFGAWHETAANIHLALMAGALDGLGYGQALGRFIMEDGATLTTAAALAQAIAAEPGHALAAARADLLRAMAEHGLPAGRMEVAHRWRHASILGQAWRRLP